MPLQLAQDSWTQPTTIGGVLVNGELCSRYTHGN